MGPNSMRIIISPAKKMNVDTDSLPVRDLPAFLEQTEELCRELQNKSLKMLEAFVVRKEKIYIWANVVDVTMTLLRNGVAYGYLLWQTLEQGLSASEFLLYFTAVSGFTTWITGILSTFSQLHKESIALSHVQEYLDLPEQFKFEEGVTPDKADGYMLTLENVSFRYPGTETNILENVNL